MKRIIFLSSCLLILNTAFVYSQGGWVQIESGISNHLNKIFFANSNEGWIVGEGGRILHTSNAGANWQIQNSNISVSLRSVYFINENTGWAAGGYFDPNLSQPTKFILKTTNSGNSWSTIYFSVDFLNTLYDVYFTNVNTGFVTGFGGGGFVSTGIILMTTDAGNNWTGIEFNSPKAIQFTSQNNGWVISNYWNDVGIDSAYIYRSENQGINWSLVFNQEKISMRSLYFLNNLIGWVGGVDHLNFMSQPILLKTIDGGNNWSNIKLINQNIPNSIFFVSENKGWSCNNGIYHTTNGGNNWDVQLISVSGNDFNSIVFLDSIKGFVVGANGKIYRTFTGGLNSFNYTNENIPDIFSLSQNYPNPFNPATKINFSIPENSYVSLKVYDVLGKEVAALINENLDAGSYNFDFNAANLTSGVYFYKLTTEKYSDIKKMTLLK